MTAKLFLRAQCVSSLWGMCKERYAPGVLQSPTEPATGGVGRKSLVTRNFSLGGYNTTAMAFFVLLLTSNNKNLAARSRLPHICGK
jgi:hypothetical protein